MGQTAADSEPAPFASGGATPRRSARLRAGAWRCGLRPVRATVRRKILLAFLAISAITGGLGAYAVYSVQDAGGLVGKTFDRALMSISYARAVSASFAGMEAVRARRRAAPPAWHA